MKRTRYVALLRGVNVGGRNPVPMAALRDCFADAGYDDVRTYIQSGNVLFSSDAPRNGLERAIEATLERRFRTPLTVVVRTHRQLRSVVANKPAGFGERPDEYHSDVIFLKAPLAPRAAATAVELREGVDEVWPGTGVLYLARLTARLSQSRTNKLAARPEYQQMTIRSWTTTTKLLALLDDPPG